MTTEGPVTAALTATISHASGPASEPEGTKELSHHRKDGKGFINPWPSWNMMSAPTIVWGLIKRRFNGTANVPNTKPPTVAIRKPTFLTARSPSQLRATWLGHACYLVEFPTGFRVLFDPVFEDRCSPFSWLGPKRYNPVPCQIDAIPTIDAVIISHNHYDHLSHPTITQIKKRHPNVHFFVPLGNKKWFVEGGFHNVTELDWWEDRDIRLSANETPQSSTKVSESSTNPTKDVTATISCLPSQHMSARGLFDRASTLWASWSITSGGKKLWFAGDTGYRGVPELPKTADDYDPQYNFPHCPAFKQIGDLRGPFDLGLIPIGAYDPRWIMSSMHANPFDSVNIFQDTRCKRALGMHWGTWVLTEEDVLEPPRLLKEALKRKNIPEEGIFDVCELGESREF
ncbi:MAG: hypothetical protein M1833_002145 [Piccolia ochrophora]|nr:MAG: hypothetical protein M1833_002145 [Piccolia ochrophora]